MDPAPLERRRRTSADLRRAKELGFSDRAIARAARMRRGGGPEVSARRRDPPGSGSIDTLAGEWPSPTNYLYLTYRADADDVAPSPEGSILVLGAGPYRIGSSVEFDWSTMNLVDGLKAEGVPVRSPCSTRTPRRSPRTTTAPTGSTSRRSPSSGCGTSASSTTSAASSRASAASSPRT